MSMTTCSTSRMEPETACALRPGHSRIANAATALLSNPRRALERFGRPRVDAEQLLQWVADWAMRDGPTLNKPTHFESREGKF